MKALLTDLWVKERIDAAIAPYVGVLSTEQIAWMREQLADTLANDPEAALLMRRARENEIDESGEMSCHPAVPASTRRDKVG